MKPGTEVSVFGKNILSLVLFCTFRVSFKRKQHNVRNVFCIRKIKKTFWNMAAAVDWLLRDHSFFNTLFYYATTLLLIEFRRGLSNPCLETPSSEAMVCNPLCWLGEKSLRVLTDVGSLLRGTKIPGRVCTARGPGVGSELRSGLLQRAWTLLWMEIPCTGVWAAQPLLLVGFVNWDSLEWTRWSQEGCLCLHPAFCRVPVTGSTKMEVLFSVYY